MSDHDPNDREPVDRPVASGLVALVAVALAVGLVLAGVVLVGTRVLGLGDGGGSSSGEAGAGQSMILPHPQHTTPTGGPMVTLATENSATDEPSASESSADHASDDATSKGPKNTDQPISLQAAELQVDASGRIDISGTYPGGEGAILQVQRLEGGAWTKFPATVAVSNRTFSTYIFTGQTGVNKFRVIDNATGKKSNVISVTVG